MRKMVWRMPEKPVCGFQEANICLTCTVCNVCLCGLIEASQTICLEAIRKTSVHQKARMPDTQSFIALCVVKLLAVLCTLRFKILFWLVYTVI